ncbi:hypothetical protein ASPWEDRAFT_42274 [Aspergillus wentii DTO 134E9]|uniref:Uncharacterized protein n=1 Tax=Aspergillus wentii DTO 134E9 TaxID=1073089 RepID=A0A1L9RHA2_ASPWE|nr:uncharacterized protein ASPWEDRAFT_42274 [Aspergillus wentii DTO 134E9]OJJ34305.1 hypothetical protein ASPWEDRAFT_42274 [Aspergillus wentii DTO 134E9]
MESDKANSDTKTEVDIMILDYLLCITIDRIIHTKIEARQSYTYDWDSVWLLHSVSTIKSKIPTSQTPTQDMRIKLQLLAFATLFLFNLPNPDSRSVSPGSSRSTNGETSNAAGNTTTADGQLSETWLLPNPMSHENDTRNEDSCKARTPISEIATEFISLCFIAEAKISEPRWMDLAAQFAMHAMIEEYQASGDISTLKPLNEYIAWTATNFDQAQKWSKECAKYIKYLRPLPGTLLQDHLQVVSANMSGSRFAETVVDFLTDLMRTLEPPVLIQLERGKLGGLSRAETQQLKERVGLQ